jgi:hypothetical protein
MIALVSATLPSPGTSIGTGPSLDDTEQMKSSIMSVFVRRRPFACRRTREAPFPKPNSLEIRRSTWNLRLWSCGKTHSGIAAENFPRQFRPYWMIVPLIKQCSWIISLMDVIHI